MLPSPLGGLNFEILALKIVGGLFQLCTHYIPGTAHITEIMLPKQLMALLKFPRAHEQNMR